MSVNNLGDMSNILFFPFSIYESQFMRENVLNGKTKQYKYSNITKKYF